MDRADATAVDAGPADGGTDGAPEGGVDDGAVGSFDAGPDSTLDARADCEAATFEGHGYLFCGEPLDWASAHEACLLQGMHLVRIDSAAENDWVRMLAYAGIVGGRITSADWRWLGASDENADGDWYWSDGDLFWQGGRSGMAVGGAFTHWAATSPRNNTLDARCAAIQGDANPNWEDVACTHLRSFVCEAY